jgi:hypothetical protein
MSNTSLMVAEKCRNTMQACHMNVYIFVPNYFAVAAINIVEFLNVTYRHFKLQKS